MCVRVFRGGAFPTFDVVNSRDILVSVTYPSWLRPVSLLRNINIDPGKAAPEAGSDIFFLRISQLTWIFGCVDYRRDNNNGRMLVEKVTSLVGTTAS